jgi:hypothetical protein
MQSSFIKRISLFILLLVIVNCLCLLFQQKLLSYKIDVRVVITANSLLFVVSIIGLALQTKTVNSKNPNAAIRGVIGAAILKLLVLIIAAVLYVYIEREKTNIGAIIISMVLYIVYAVIETRTALKINQQQSAGDRTSAS